MKLKLFQVDAFTDTLFKGNPACVVPLKEWLPDDVLKNIARENAVPETAFFVKDQKGFHLRWFTPDIEMDLCGHATLATAHILKTSLKTDRDVYEFNSASGVLKVTEDAGIYTLDFPARRASPAALPDVIKASINTLPREVLKSRDLVLVYDSEKEVRDIHIERNTFDQINLNPGGLIVTAKGNSCDFVSRYFTPQATVLEDPVTGSAHCTLIPYWSSRLNKTKMLARQISARGGELHCEDAGNRVKIGGCARTYLEGSVWVD